MTVKIVIKFDRRLLSSQAMQRVVWNAARMVRDLWLSKTPYLSGDYAKGLQRPGSIGVSPGRITVQNFSPHAGIYESGHKAFNWGLATLNKGKNVKTAKDGSKYKIIKIDPKGRVAFRKASTGAAVISAFQATVPKGRGKFASYGGRGDIGKLRTHARLLKPIKPRKSLVGAMRGFFVVSERAIKANPKRWFHEKQEGHYVARDVQKTVEPIIKRAIAQAAAAEAALKERRGRK